MYSSTGIKKSRTGGMGNIFYKLHNNLNSTILVVYYIRDKFVMGGTKWLIRVTGPRLPTHDSILNPAIAFAHP